jgi:hypothetical protein
MKNLKLILSFICLFGIILFPSISFTEPQIEGSYEKSSEEVLFNTGIHTIYLNTYNIEGQRDIFICVEDLEGLGYDKNWSAFRRRTIFTRKNTGKKTNTPYFEDMNFSIDEDLLKKNRIKLRDKGSIYKSNVKVYIDDKEAKTYNTGGYSLIGLKELRKLQIPYFFSFNRDAYSNQKLYPLLTSKGYGLVDINTNLIVKPQFSHIYFPENDTKNLLALNNGYYSIIDHEGHLIKDLFKDEEGLYITVKKDYIISKQVRKNSPYRIYDFNGNDLFNEDFQSINVIDENHIWVQTKDLMGKVYKKEGNSFNEFYTSNREGYKVFYIKDNLMFSSKYYKDPILIINKDNDKEILSDNEYIKIYTFHNGYSLVKLPNKRYTFIDTNLKRVTNEDFKDAGRVHNDLFAFLKDGEYTGLSSAEGLHGAKFGLMDIKKGLILPAEYKKIRVYEEGYIRFSKEGKKYGICNLSGQVILKEKFDHILLKDSYFYGLEGDIFHIYDMGGKLISQEKNIDQYDLRENTSYYVQFWDDRKKDELPCGGNWSDYRRGEKLPQGIKAFVLHPYKDEECHYGFGSVNSILTDEGLLIPYGITHRGMPVPPPDSILPTHLMK